MTSFRLNTDLGRLALAGITPESQAAHGQQVIAQTNETDLDGVLIGG